MDGPRAPTEREFPRVLEFLNSNLRPNANWSIASEYPTALTEANLNNIRIITEGDEVLSHSVIKPLIIRSPTIMYKVAAIGSVVTDNTRRGQGLSSQILNECTQEAQKQECDIAMLWTNLYDFYRRLDFELAGFEESVVIEKEFAADLHNLRFIKGTKISAESLHRLYCQHSVGSVRTVEDIRKYLTIPNTCLYTAWDGHGQLVAYAVEGKGADLSGYIHEWGGAVSKLMALFSWMRSEKQAPFTIILAHHSLNLLSALRSIPGALHNEGYLGMIKLINEQQLFAKVHRAARTVGIPNLILQKTATGYALGVGQDSVEFTDQKDMVRILFGPLPEIPHLAPQTMDTLERILPLPLWIWGWDSI